MDRQDMCIMLDLETAGTANNAAVFSVSAVIFSLSTGEVFNEFEQFAEIQGQVDKGAVIDVGTFLWWLAQGEDARRMIIKGQEKASPAREVVAQFNYWLECALSKEELENVQMWGNGATADDVWLRNMFNREGMECVVPFWADADMRTLVKFTGCEKIKKEMPFEGVKHNGLDDCKHQVKICHAAWVKVYGGIA